MHPLYRETGKEVFFCKKISDSKLPDIYDLVMF